MRADTHIHTHTHTHTEAGSRVHVVIVFSSGCEETGRQKLDKEESKAVQLSQYTNMIERDEKEHGRLELKAEKTGRKRGEKDSLSYKERLLALVPLPFPSPNLTVGAGLPGGERTASLAGICGGLRSALFCLTD
mmetsp:Transcript_12636/g.24586  ORF Transcript_12636/g.24586 Transcript_12636/m.24586 type:complete len:134 (-) Transcript_12636:1182-1583(-)